MDNNNNGSNITQQLRVVFGISIFILLASSLASYYSNRKLIETSVLVNHTNEVIKTAEELVTMLNEAQGSQRGFLITGDSVFLQPYILDKEKVSRVLDTLRTLTNDNDKQQQNVSKVKVLVEQRFAQMEEVLKVYAENRDVNAARNEAGFLSEMNEGRVIMRDLKDVVRQVEDVEEQLLMERTKAQETYIKYTPMLASFAALVSILISVLAYFRIKADIDERVRKQKEEEAKYIATGKRIAEMERVTKSIADGNLDVRSGDTEGDELGRIGVALNSMVSSLEVNFEELEKRDWLQTGAAALTDAIRGERFVNHVSGKIVRIMAEYTSAQVGTLYVADKNLNMKLCGAYAATNAPDEIPGGKGMVGQAALGKSIIVSTDLPPDYLKIQSSIGSTSAVYSVLLPLIHADTVISVVELGYLQKPGAQVLDFLENNAEAMAIAIATTLNYEQIQNLLEETQAQSEELQAQHSELENINDELKAQAEKLQASEEELRVQQEELQQANRELEENTSLLEERNTMIQERNHEIIRKAEELELSTKYKSEFLANMSHELRTPLNSILLLSRLLSENNEKNLNTDQVEYAKVIQSSGNGLLALIDEILDLSKIEAGKMKLEYEEVPVAEIASDMQSLFDPVAAENKIDLLIDIKDDVPDLINIDKQRLEQVLKNLLSNSLKFTRQGYVRLDILLNEQRKGFVDFSVRDTGIGIPADKQKLIFEAFQQADGSTRRKYGGTGLGLSISKEIARLLGGTITLESVPGEGSVFTISVPLSPGAQDIEDIQETVFADMPEVAKINEEDDTKDDFISMHIPDAVPDDRDKIKAPDKSILIIEDDVNFAKSLLEFTRRRGYKGIVSVRGDEGVVLAKKYNPIGILLDVQLPVKSGLQVMDELKSNPQTRHIPVHMMSSYSLKKESLYKGAVDFINKPVAFEEMQEVFDKLERVLNKTTKKVLIVEDNPKHAKALAYFLKTFNVNSNIKTTVQDSISALKTDRDCVILDMAMPHNVTYDMLEGIKQNPGLENVPIIVFTGKSLSLSEEQKIKRYADSIIVKTAHSYQRVLDEVSIFLHMVEEHKNEVPKKASKKLGALNEVLNNKKVLVVDDDVRNIFSLTKALENVNMTILTAIDGKDAIEQLKANNDIDIVLLDMMMPQMDGYETAKKIRENKTWKHLPVIAVTAKAMSGDREKCIKAGASDYITKPVDLDQLLSLLRVWLYDKSTN